MKIINSNNKPNNTKLKNSNNFLQIRICLRQTFLINFRKNSNQDNLIFLLIINKISIKIILHYNKISDNKSNNHKKHTNKISMKIIINF